MGAGEYGANGDYGGGDFNAGGFEQQSNGEVQSNGFDNGGGFQQDHMVRAALTTPYLVEYIPEPIAVPTYCTLRGVL